jgi:hypothetical protein
LHTAVKGTLQSSTIALEAERKAQEHAEQVERDRRLAIERRRADAVRRQVVSFLRSAVLSFIAEGHVPGRDTLRNAHLLQSAERLLNRSYDIEVIETLGEKQTELLLTAVGITESILTFLPPFWQDNEPSDASINQIRLKCAMAIGYMLEALTVLGYREPHMQHLRKECDSLFERGREGLSSDGA